MKKKKEEVSKLDKLFLDAQRRLEVSSSSIKKMKDYLKKKGANKKEVEEIISKLKKYSFIDEDEIIKSVISYADLKHYGYRKIIEILRLKEIEPSKIALIKKDTEREVRESKNMQNRLIKRYKNKNTLNLRQSVYNALIRYGFDENIASQRSSEVYNSPSKEKDVLILEYRKLIASNFKKEKGKALDNKIKEKLLSKGFKLDDIRKVTDNTYEMD